MSDVHNYSRFESSLNEILILKYRKSFSTSLQTYKPLENSICKSPSPNQPRQGRCIYSSPISPITAL